MAETRRCSRCAQDLPLEAFNRKGTGLQSLCRLCNRAYLREHYRNNPAYYAEKSTDEEANAAGVPRAHPSVLR